MRAKLKQLHSPDIDLQNFSPENEDNFGFLLEASIGVENSEGADIFQIMVCTPEWLKSELKYMEKKVLWGHHMLIVLNYDLDSIKSEIEKYIDHCIGTNWNEIARKIGLIAQWEFENYGK